MSDEILLQCDQAGKITYPSTGATNIFDALSIVENKLNARYVAEQEAEHEHQLEPLPTPESIYQTVEDKRISDKLEKACLVKAYLKYPTWKERVKYLSECGFDYPGTNSAIAQRLNKKVDALTLSGEWDKLVEVVEGE